MNIIEKLKSGKKTKFYSLQKILSTDSVYNMVIGERSNGKTYSVLEYSIIKFMEDRSQIGIIRRWQEDIKGSRASGIYRALIDDGKIFNLTKGEYQGVYYYGGRFYLCNYNEDGKAIYNDNDLLGFAFALSDTEHNKSVSFPKVTTILFDEFLTRHVYLPDEFVLFMNTVSTIVRQRENVKIFMLGNTVNKFSPYFQEMGLNHIQKMKQGTIDVYTYGDSKLKVAVEYAPSTENNKKSNFYFAFDNPKLNMITSGSWELNIYPHLPVKYKPKDIKLTYFIEFDGNTFQCEIIEVDGEVFTYIHEKTTPIKDIDNDIVYSLDISHKMNYNRSIFKTTHKLSKVISSFFINDKVFYQNNDVGDTINNYLKQCR